MAPLLLTPGPLTTAEAVRQAMLRDWGSREPNFIALSVEIAKRLVAIANADTTHDAVLFPGSGTFAVEATIGGLVGPDDRLLILINGAYGKRMAEITERLGLDFATLIWPEDQPVDPEMVAQFIMADGAITHVAMVHCETTTGLLNPLVPLARVVAANGCQLIVDAMSSFGALPIDLKAIPATAVVAASGKCLECVPGVSFVLVDWKVLSRCTHRPPSFALALREQWKVFRESGQWRFTPPVQVVAGLRAALDLLDSEGGPPGRLLRYTRNLDILSRGLSARGFVPILARQWQAPIIVTFPMPPRLTGGFQALYGGLAQRGFIIYPGKLTQRDTFRVGCIGAFPPERLHQFVAAFDEVLAELRSTHERNLPAL